jgi:hypothetical protein
MTLIYFTALGYAGAAFGLSVLYLRRYRLSRPPIGVFNLTDVLLVLAVIIIAHFLAVFLPLWLALSLLGLASFMMLYNTLEPLLPHRWAIGAAALGIVGLVVGSRLLWGGPSLPFLLINSLAQTIIIVGVTNLWVQSGLNARNAVVLISGIGLFDFIATAQIGLMDQVVERLSGFPFEPFVGGFGLGDILMMTLFTLIMEKAFGRLAARVAALISFVAIAIAVFVVEAGWVAPIIPMMTPMVPLVILQYLYWQRRYGSERTLGQYWSASEASPVASTGY